MYTKYTFLLSLSLIVSGCTSTPSIGDKMILQGTSTQSLGKTWGHGQELVEKGRKRIQHGEQLVKKGKDQISEGRTMIKKGNKVIRNSEQSFSEKFPEIPLN